MQEVILTVGPQGAGKSTFCNKALSVEPSINLVSRDTVLVELFGTTTTDPYTSAQQVAMHRMWELVEKRLTQPNVLLILDAWNGWPSERKHMTDKLRSLGADRIIAWHFITDIDTCVEWYMQREMQKENLSEWDHEANGRACRRNYGVFHSTPVDLDQGFDAIHRINPLSMGPQDVLVLQTSFQL